MAGGLGNRGKLLCLMVSMSLTSAFRLPMLSSAPVQACEGVLSSSDGLTALHNRRLAQFGARSFAVSTRACSMPWKMSSSDSSVKAGTLSLQPQGEALKKQIELLWDLEDSIKQMNFAVLVKLPIR